MARLSIGDVVVRSHRRLKTVGTVVRFVLQRRGEAQEVWVKWDHSNTLPNPSRETVDALELVRRSDEPPPAPESAPVL